MRETRDGLKNLEKTVDMNLRLKNELNVDSRDYWKTHTTTTKRFLKVSKVSRKSRTTKVVIPCHLMKTKNPTWILCIVYQLY